MSARILEGKAFAEKIKSDVMHRADQYRTKHGESPNLTVIMVGDDPASQVYVRNKHRACEELGIGSQIIAMPENTTKKELLEKIAFLNMDRHIHGILVQLPLPESVGVCQNEVLCSIDPQKDVDGFHPLNAGKLVSGIPGLTPCTPAGCMRMLDLAKIPIEGKRAVILGRSNIVGKPMMHMLLSHDATVTICHSHTKDLSAISREADILVAAVGKPRFVTADMVKPGATVIDVGINRIAPKKLAGDVDFEAVKEVAGAITPVPGGVGLLTVAMLMENVVRAAEVQSIMM